MPRILRTASSSLSSVKRPSSYALRTYAISSAISLAKRNISQPAIIAPGTASHLLLVALIPTMCEASVITSPLKFISSLKRSVNNSFESVAGLISLSSIPGTNFLLISGRAI